MHSEAAIPQPSKVRYYLFWRILSIIGRLEISKIRLRIGSELLKSNAILYHVSIEHYRYQLSPYILVLL